MGEEALRCAVRAERRARASAQAERAAERAAERSGAKRCARLLILRTCASRWHGMALCSGVQLYFPREDDDDMFICQTSRASIFVMYSNNGGGGLPSLHVDGGACSIARLIAYSEYSGCKVSIESIVGYVE